jgi:hypothetical protein
MVTGLMCVPPTVLLGAWAAQSYGASATRRQLQVSVAPPFDLIRNFHRWMLAEISCQPVCRAHRHLTVIAIPDRVDPMAHCQHCTPGIVCSS